MYIRHFVSTAWRHALCVLALVALTGCAGYDLEVDAPFLDQVGLSTSTKQKAPKLKERAPLIVPPTAQLPTPGTVTQAPQDLNWPDDPDLRAKQIAKANAAAQAKKDKDQGFLNKMINGALNNNDDEEEAATAATGDGNPVPPGTNTQASTPKTDDWESPQERRVQEILN